MGKLKVLRYSDVPVENMEGGAFCERAEVQRFITPNDSKDFRVFIVHFPSGHRTRWHIHDCDQALYILAGIGIVANEDTQYEVTPGTFVLIPAGERHWHGAKKESHLTHIMILKAVSKETMFECPNT
ncbi:MAG: cupin domain-containing protein [Candidatus Bathyarchaeia archaeon]